MKCQHCNNEFDEKMIQEHHLHPRFMDNFKGLGIKVQLCEKCHNILHLKISAIIWRYILDSKKEECINKVKEFTTKQIKKENESKDLWNINKINEYVNEELKKL